MRTCRNFTPRAKTAHYFVRFEPNCQYHVFNRAIDKKDLFLSADNYSFFLRQYDKIETWTDSARMTKAACSFLLVFPLHEVCESPYFHAFQNTRSTTFAH